MNINNSIKGVRDAPKVNRSFDTGRSAKSNGDSFKTLLNQSTTTSQGQPHVRTDKIQFSHSAPQGNGLELSNLKTKISDDLKAETRTAKIDRISKQIENNEYKVDPYELAQIMFRV